MEEAVTAKWRFMGKKKKKWRAGGRCDASGQPRTNQCTLPLWSIHASPDYSRGTQISDPRATPVIIFLTQISAKQQLRPPPSQRTSSSPANHSDCRWQTPSAHRRGMSVIFFVLPLFPRAKQRCDRARKRTGPLHHGGQLHHRSVMLLNS